ncbi:Zn(II)2Cys6 transcription factor domain-containing protein [Aspergillus foveolatus]|uniref:Zn(II)2Cys6 transcription factor domain-containing protein n=1 Tax=Aspergillus foveolatus TaxID=210207 RepID=UPI003CCD29FA
MADDASTSISTCPICLETFRRAEHLKRHTPTREDLTPSAPRTCPLTEDADDDAKRHTCHFCRAQRRLSGKRKQACGLCTARKRACSTGLPCSECAMRKAECTYHRVRSSTRLRESLDSAGRTPSETTDAGIAGQGVMEQIQAQAHGIVSLTQDRSTSIQGPRFGFLANFTRANGLNEAYIYRSQPATINLSSLPLKEKGGADGEGLQGATASNPFDCYLDEFESCLWSDTDTARDPVEEVLLAEKARQTWDSLQSDLDSPTAQHSRVTASEWLEFFSPANATPYLRLFWTRWYHHCPIVHRATFTDHQMAKRFLDVMEDHIFSNSLFLESPRLESRNENLLQAREKLQILQATCFMCLLQKWEGSTTRAMGLPQARHPRINLNSSVTVEAWNEYTFKAEMIRSDPSPAKQPLLTADDQKLQPRLPPDSAFVIFHNSVPRMVLQEMTIDLTCPEDVFQAVSPAEFTRVLRLHPACTVPLLTDCVRNLCAETLDPDVIAHLGHAGALNLFTIATGEESPK